MSRRAAFGLALLVVAGVVGCDGVSKQRAQAALRGQPPVPLVAGVLDLRYAENRGVAFNLERILPERARRPLVLGAGLVLLPALALAWRARRAGSLTLHLGFAALLGGAVGNLGERVLRGYVIDFIHVPPWPVFNVADVAIVVGVALLAIAGRRGPGSDRCSTAASS